MRLEDCCTHCTACQRVYCRDIHITPAGADELCGDCDQGDE